ncbi:MAG: protoporphyrinogen oxidase, partial [Pyrinomonadaceae bacterium]
MKRIVIIGGGISGLAAAHRLVELRKKTGIEFEITLLEASSRLGGVIQTDHRHGFLLERGPDSFISEKPATLELARRIGLETHLIETNREHRRSFVVQNGKLRPVPEGFYLIAPARFRPWLSSDIFSWTGKARMAMDLLLPRRITNGSDDESLANFVRRRLGREALERMAQPMVGGIYTADPEKLSLRATIPRFLEMERTHGSVIRGLKEENASVSSVSRWLINLKRAFTTETQKTLTKDALTLKRDASGPRYSLFLSFDRGMQILVDALAARLPRNAIRLNVAVASIRLERDPNRWIIETGSNESVQADALCVALPAHAAAKLFDPTDPILANELKAIPYASTATINLAYRREQIPHSLDGFGFVVPFIEKRSLLACSFSSVKFAGRAPECHTLLRAFVGGALQPEVLRLDESEIIERVRNDLRELLSIREPPLFAELSRWASSMPQYEVGHLSRLSRISDRVVQLPALKLAGNAYHGVGIPD